jgi:NADH-quinone oxidoreductase subunit L
MLVALLLHGAVFVGFLCVYGRWLDEEITADVCLFGLLFELLGAVGLLRYVHTADAVLCLNLGAPTAFWAAPSIQLSLCFDEISGFFFSILAFALVLCFFFLIEYFEYDFNTSTIVTLSALFSQAALLYFCVFDLCLLIFFWEVISFISFLLVQHWAFRVSSYKAGLKVFFVSQVGDLPFFLFVFFMLARVQTSDIAELLSLAACLSFEYVMVGSATVHLNTLLSLLLQVAIFLKAAQWFFYPWLLDAMEAPVPISAQLHSSTLVVIGFFLFFRFQPYFEGAPFSAKVALLAGILTSVGASVLGYFQDDGKKLLACSTASQLGYVIVALGLHLYSEALFLLSFCCCNKAFTFVWFGAFMRRHGGVSDFRMVGGQGLTWVENAGLAVAVANFTVFPGAFCWHVKGLFLQGALVETSPLLVVGLGLLQLTWFFSSLYLCSLYFSLFLGARRGPGRVAGGGHSYAQLWLTGVTRQYPVAGLPSLAPV